MKKQTIRFLALFLAVVVMCVLGLSGCAPKEVTLRVLLGKLVIGCKVKDQILSPFITQGRKAVTGIKIGTPNCHSTT